MEGYIHHSNQERPYFHSSAGMYNRQLVGSCCETQGAQLVLGDDLGGWDGGREGGPRGRGHVYACG